MKENDFYTLKGYEQKYHNKITGSMEDYLEMICRCAESENTVRINTLAKRLNVRPSSASKMVTHLKEEGLVEFERYSTVRPTKKGWELGEYLLYRHALLHRFFCFINRSDCEIEQVEQIEHYIDRRTIKNMESLLDKMQLLRADGTL